MILGMRYHDQRDFHGEIVFWALRRFHRRFRLVKLKFMARLINLAWRIRRKFSTTLQRPNTAERASALNLTTDSAEDVSPSPSTSLNPIVLRKRYPSQPACDLEHKSLMRIFKRCTVPAYDFPEDSTFALFSNFPAEIRIQVWQYASSFSRVVEIQHIDPTTGLRRSASPPVPALLHACRESRYEALKVYKPCFGTKKVPKSIYINPACDVLFFRVGEPNQTWRYMLGPNHIWREQMKDVRRIAFLYIEQDSDLSSLRHMKKTLCAFPNLEELIVLWAEDAPMRPLGGRGMNFIEHGLGHIDIKKYNSWCSALRWKKMIVELWDSDQWWRELGREPPTTSVKHWCMRNESDW